MGIINSHRSNAGLQILQAEHDFKIKFTHLVPRKCQCRQVQYFLGELQPLFCCVFAKSAFMNFLILYRITHYGLYTYKA